MIKKDSEKTQPYQFTDEDREKALEADNHGKRGIGKATIYKQLLESMTQAQNQAARADLFAAVMNGNYGEKVKIQFLLQATELAQKQEADLNKLRVKHELDIERVNHQYELSKKDRMYLLAAKKLVGTWDEQQLEKFIEQEESQ